MDNDHQPKHRAPWSGLASDASEADIGILGIPYDGAASFRRGAAQAPVRIRSLTPHVAPYTEDGAALSGLRIHDVGDVVVSGDWDSLTRQVMSKLHEILPLPFSIVLGGDHSITIPVIRELAHVVDGPMGYLHIDAHLDLMNTFEGLRHSHACTARRVLESPNVAPENALFLGIRSWLDEELAFLRDHPEIQVLTAAAIADNGIPAVLHRILPVFRDVAAVYVSIDVDVLDPAYAPGTGTPEAGGLSTRALLQILKPVFAKLPVRALDIVEVSPPLDCSDITSFAAVKLLYEVFGWVKDRNNA